jgi:two-component system, sensor histidine kinase
MENNLPSISLKRKLLLSFILTSLVAIITTASAVLIIENSKFYKLGIEQIETLTRVVGWNSAASLIFKDKKSAKEIVSSVGRHEHIISAILFDAQKNIFVEYSGARYEFRNELKLTDNNVIGSTVLERIGNSEVAISSMPIETNGLLSGYIVLVYDLEFIDKSLDERLAAVSLVTVLSIVFSVAILTSLGRVIFRPIENIISTIGKISREKNYSVRLPIGTFDEIGLLSREFNLMLSEIEVRDLKIEAKKQDLEDTVVKRTKELVLANSNLEKLLKELELKSRQAESASREKSEFIATMSHEIRTPVHGILGFSSIIKSNKTFGKTLDYLLKIEKSAQFLMGLVDDILDLSKINQNNIELDYEKTNLHELAATIRDLYCDLAQNKGLEFKVLTDTWIPDYVICDKRRISQIVNNLISNSIKFTDKGKILVNIVATRNIESNNQCCLIILVSDTGIGIPIKQRERVFSAFTQSDSSITRDFGGTGLGLSISRKLAQKMGGNVTYDSVDGYTTTFKFSANFECFQEENSGLLPKIGDNFIEKTVENCYRRKILVVDDNILNLELASTFLEKLGCNVEIAKNGKDAISKTSSMAFDFIFMDCHMPIMDGLTATSIIRNDAQEWTISVPIIAMTADISKEIRLQCNEAGTSAYISKPFSEADIKRLLDEYL